MDPVMAAAPDSIDMYGRDLKQCRFHVLTNPLVICLLYNRSTVDRVDINPANPPNEISHFLEEIT